MTASNYIFPVICCMNHTHFALHCLHWLGLSAMYIGPPHNRRGTWNFFAQFEQGVVALLLSLTEVACPQNPSEKRLLCELAGETSPARLLSICRHVLPSTQLHLVATLVGKRTLSSARQATRRNPLFSLKSRPRQRCYLFADISLAIASRSLRISCT